MLTSLFVEDLVCWLVLIQLKVFDSESLREMVFYIVPSSLHVTIPCHHPYCHCRCLLFKVNKCKMSVQTFSVYEFQMFFFLRIDRFWRHKSHSVDRPIIPNLLYVTICFVWTFFIQDFQGTSFIFQMFSLCFP